MKCYKIRLQNDSLTFAAAHFITFSGGDCEMLHGHDFRAVLEMEAALDADGGYVMDFLAVQQAIRETLKTLDHKILLPDRNPYLQLSVREVEQEAAVDIQGWVSSVGKWLTEVNDYQTDNDMAEEVPAVAHEMGVPPLPDAENEEDGVSTLFFQEDSLKAEVEVRHKSRRWVFPEEDCVILPLENTTAELLADYLLQKLLQHVIFRHIPPPRFARLELTESTGMTGVCEIRNEE